MIMENHGGMISPVENSWFVHQSYLETLPAESSVAKQEELAKEMNFSIRNISFILRRVFNVP
jgi:hypothetical protein